MSFPRFGLAARLTLLMIALLLVGQLVNAVILGIAEKDFRLQRAEAVLAERVVQAARLVENAPRLSRRLARRQGLRLTDGPPSRGEPNPRAEQLVGEALEANGLTSRAYAVRMIEGERGALLIAGVELEEGQWIHYRQPLPPGGGVPWRAIAIQTGILSIILILPAIWLSRVVAGPLRQLRAAADGVLTGRPAPELPTGGPPDINALCLAFASLEQRVMAALEEKSMMLGAVGHDLRTPLASLRIRVESVEDDRLRDAMIASLDGISATLDDILTFSRTTSEGTFEDIRTDALIRSLEAEYDEAQLRVGTVDALTLRCAPQSVLRALRNLIDNAVRYGSAAEVTVEDRLGEVVFAVSDRGPGISEGEIERLQRPFTRQEGSRNRGSGGAGLGLAIAKAVAEAHQGRLVLSNRSGGGLTAQIILPAGAVD